MPEKSTDILTKAAGQFAAAKAGEVVSNLGKRASGNAPQKDKDPDDDSKGFLGNTVENIAGGGSAVGSAVKGLGTTVKEGLTNLFKGKGGAKRPTNIVEDCIVGVTPEVAFAAWVDYEEWATFSKGIQSVNIKDADETDEDSEEETTWTAKVFLSRRAWNARTVDFDPPYRIAWVSEGAKGTIDGTVTFTPIGDNSTQILVVLEYRSKGPVEWIANRWRAAGRRARLDVKHYRRYVMRTEPDDLDSTDKWEEEPEPDETAEEDSL